MHPLSPSHQTLFAAYETYLRQKTLVDASRKRLLRLARRYLHYLDTEYPGIEATRISYPQCCAFLQTLEHLKVSSYNLYLVDLRGFLQFLEKQHGAKVISHQLRRKTAEINLPRGLPLDLMQQLCTPKATEAAALETSLLAMRNQAIIELLFLPVCVPANCCSCASGIFPRTLAVVPWLRPSTVWITSPGSASLLLPPCDVISWREGCIRKGRSCLAVSRQKRATPQIWRITQCHQKNQPGPYRLPCYATHHPPHLATQMLIGCGCIRSVQLMLGHACLSNTARYCAVEFVHLLAAVRGFHPHGGEPANRAETLDRAVANE